MGEIEGSIGVAQYKDLLDMMPAEKLPVSRDELRILQGSMKYWYPDFYNMHSPLVKEYGDGVVRATRLHHLLSGSSLPISDWEKFKNDTPGGEMGDFTRSVVEKYGPEDKGALDRTA
ncbi:MAG: hypothetical protein NTZ65_01490 [Candidatus Berkelbacteria bacterium]|nr:hypothetical protein [Candidatus Berkelbacteria bacterium]